MSDESRRSDKAADERMRNAGGSTRAVHSGERNHQATHAVTTPIYQTSTFWFENSAELRALQEGRDKRDEYGRYGNPTWRAVERKLCELEGAEEAVLFASGMCAATTLFFALLPIGSLKCSIESIKRQQPFGLHWVSSSISSSPSARTAQSMRATALVNRSSGI